MNANEMTLADALARIAALEAENDELAGLAHVVRLKAQGFKYKYVTTLVRHGDKPQPFTPTAVDAVRKAYWSQHAYRSRAEIRAKLISQGWEKATVNTQLSRLYAGIDESCHNPAIRERLGLVETADADDAE